MLTCTATKFSALAGFVLGVTLVCTQSVVASTSITSAAPDQVLQGELHRADHQTYLELPFVLPPGVEQLRVVFSYDRGEGTVIDLGLRDPGRFRGWSGGNKQTFTVGERSATLSYLPGPMPTGTWHLLLGIPNIRNGVSTTYRADIYFESNTSEAGWYRGDFHAHSGHSDGACASQSGARIPCPLVRTLEAAAARGLDFVSLTEHNTWSHRQELAGLQIVNDRMLLLTGMELTTFSGHANLFGDMESFDFPAAARNLSRTFADVRASGGLVSINHPGLPSDERCLGCGWAASVDGALIDAVEIVNGGVLRASGDRGASARAGVHYWESLLSAGYRVTGIGGSDNHDALLPDIEPSAIGRPTTVVYAQSLSAAGILEGVRSGRVFIDVEGTRDRRIDMTAVAVGSAEDGVQMGGSLCVPEGEEVELTLQVVTAAADHIVLILSGAELVWIPVPDVAGGTNLYHRLPSPGQDGWIRAESRSAEGTTRLISNPIYFDCQPGTTTP